ncbi:MAG: hypothetical protein M1836_001279 [Candelina mexicana]|nr:MAG: hypothetical protein M1836_001279 [Candelina mexicana]
MVHSVRRTNTTSSTSFTRPGQVTYSFDPSDPNTTTIILPPRSTWTSGLHWHETHTEFLQVIQGIACVQLQGKTLVLNAADGPITIPAFAKHQWMRVCTQGNDEDLVVKEWTSPADGQKQIFFRNLSSVIQEDYNNVWMPMSWLITLQLFAIFGALDNYPVFVEGWTERWVTHMVLWTARLLSWALGLRGYYAEYTPGVLMEREGKRMNKEG